MMTTATLRRHKAEYVRNAREVNGDGDDVILSEQVHPGGKRGLTSCQDCGGIFFLMYVFDFLLVMSSKVNQHKEMTRVCFFSLY